MDIHVHKNGQQFGPYPEQEVKNYIASGHFSQSDLGWIEGASDWVPLASLLSESKSPPLTNSISSPVVQVVAAPPPRSSSGVCIASWILIALCCLGSLIPGLGFGVWLIGAPILLITFILGIIAITRGGTVQGILILLCTLIVAPVFIIVAPLVTTGMTIAAVARDKNASVSAPDADSLPVDSEATASDSATQKSIETQPVEPRLSKNPELDTKMGFRSYKLGTPIGEFNPDDLQAGEAFIKTDMKPYFAKNFDPKLGAAEIDAIQLNFNEDLLESVTVRVKGEQNALALRETLIAGYGQPDKTTNFMTETIRWEGADCILSLDSELMGGANARFSSKSVDKKIKEIKLKKARDEAATGAGAL